MTVSKQQMYCWTIVNVLALTWQLWAKRDLVAKSDSAEPSNRALTGPGLTSTQGEAFKPGSVTDPGQIKGLNLTVDYSELSNRMLLTSSYMPNFRRYAYLGIPYSEKNETILNAIIHQGFETLQSNEIKTATLKSNDEGDFIEIASPRENMYPFIDHCYHKLDEVFGEGVAQKFVQMLSSKDEFRFDSRLIISYTPTDANPQLEVTRHFINSGLPAKSFLYSSSDKGALPDNAATRWGKLMNHAQNLYDAKNSNIH